MLDIKRIREEYESVKERVEFRGKGDFGLPNVRALDEKRRALLADVEAKKNRQNTVSRETVSKEKVSLLDGDTVKLSSSEQENSIAS